jgi:hypothetical protein
MSSIPTEHLQEVIHAKPKQFFWYRETYLPNSEIDESSFFFQATDKQN